MKVIGKASDSNFIVILNDDEVAKICGKSYWSSLDTIDKNKITSGDEIHISKIYSDFQERDNFKNEERVTEARKNLEKIMKLLAPVEVIVRELAHNKTK